MSTDLVPNNSNPAPSDVVNVESARRLFRPRADIRQSEKSVWIDLDMPGVDPDHVDVTLENRVLTVRGTVPEVNREGWTPMLTEYGEGDYQRVFTVSEYVDSDSIKATSRNGVLQLELPKAEQNMPRRITVNKGK